MRNAECIVRRLCEAGVTTMFGVPGGGSNLDLIEAGRHEGVGFVLTATETAAAIAAIAYADVSDTPGVCLTTLGPGVTSVVNGVACASLERAPLIVLTDTQDAPAGRSFDHQRVDHRALLGPIVKWSTTIDAPTAGEAIEDALRLAMSWPRGPVHIDCPGEAMRARVDAAAGGSPPTLSPRTAAAAVERSGQDRGSGLDVVALRGVHKLLTSSRTPLLVAGLGARRPEDAAAVRALAARHRVPVMVTYKAKGVVSDRDTCFAGVFTNASIERELLDRADLLIAVGLDPVELLPRPWDHRQPVVYCGRWAAAENHVPFAAQAVGEIAATLGQMGDCLPESDWDLSEVEAIVAEQRGRITPRTDGLAPHDVVRIASAAANGRNVRVTVDAGAHMLPATMLWPADEPNDMLISNGLSTMGFAVPAAIGAAIADRGRTIVALTGDGGLLMCVGELLTLAREQLPVVVVVFSDASLSLIDVKQQQRRYVSSGVALGDVGWASIAESFRMPAYVATTEEELQEAVARAFAHRGPSLVDARVDPSSYAQTIRAIRG